MTDVKSAPLELVILDVGHGNCAVIRDGDRCALVDVPRTNQVVPALVQNACTAVTHLLLSHADQDHIGGAARLLADPSVTVDNLWCNPTAIQDTDTYVDLLHQAAIRHDSRQLRYRSNLNVGAHHDLDFSRVAIDVLHPDVLHAGVGPTSARHRAGPISSNRMSAVLRVSFEASPVALLPGDLDEAGLRSILSRGADLSAPVLVFPHHGGSAGGSDNRKFAREICDAVRPELVVFSLGRSRYRNPLLEIVQGVRDSVPGAHIACTQLSRGCHTLPTTPRASSYLAPSWPSVGAAGGQCCAGTIVARLDNGSLIYEPSRAAHGTFVTGVEDPRCGPMTIDIPRARVPYDKEHTS